MSVDEEWAFGVEGGGVDNEPVLSGERRDVNGTGLGSEAEVVRGLCQDESVGAHDVDEGVLEFAALDGYGHGAAVVPGLYVGEVQASCYFCGSTFNKQIYFCSLFIGKDEMLCGEAGHDKKGNKSQ